MTNGSEQLQVSTGAGFVSATRKAMGLTQGEFATRLGISRNYVSLIEQGRKPPSRKLLARVQALAAGRAPLCGQDAAAARGLAKRRDVEAYCRELFDAVDESGDPNAYPYLLIALRERFPISRFMLPAHRERDLRARMQRIVLRATEGPADR